METVHASNFCRVCGHDVKGTVCENCGCPPYSGNRFCNVCGSETLPQAVMCPKCKNYFPSPTSAPYIDSYEDLGVNSGSSKAKRLVWTLVAIVAVVAIVFGIYAKNKDTTETTDKGITIGPVMLGKEQESSSTNQSAQPSVDEKDIRNFSKDQIRHILSLKTFESYDGSVSLKFHEDGRFEYYNGTRLQEDAGGFVKGDYGEWHKGTYQLGDIFKRTFTTTSQYYYSIKIVGEGDNGDQVPLELYQKFMSDGTSFSSWVLTNNMDVAGYFSTFVIDVFPDQEKYLHNESH